MFLLSVPDVSTSGYLLSSAFGAVKRNFKTAFKRFLSYRIERTVTLYMEEGKAQRIGCSSLSLCLTFARRLC